MTTVTLQATSVNGGTAVELYNTRVSYSWKNLVNTPPVPQKFGIVEADISGWENPSIVVEGSFSVDDLATNEIRQAHLLSFAKIQYDGTSSTAITLTVPTGNGASETNLLANDGSTTTIRVIIDDFNLEIDAGDAERGHIWRFTIKLHETA